MPDSLLDHEVQLIDPVLGTRFHEVQGSNLTTSHYDLALDD